MTMNGTQACSGERKKATPKPIITRPMVRLSQCWPGNTIGAEENRRNFLPSPASLPKAITEPEKVIAPTKVPMKSSSLLPVGSGAATPKAPGLFTAAIAISTAAMPTSECIAATSSGICVISTRRATKAPMLPPTSIASRIAARLPRDTTASVTSTAMPMPTMPNRLPRRAITGEDSPLSARMNRTFFLNIASMRCVTRKPPATFTEASPTAMMPSTAPKSVSFGAAARIAPTMITEEIALVTLMSGVCSAGVTFQITW